MRTIKFCCCLFLLVLLQACASMGKDQCVNADWRTIGYEDGARGLPAERIGQHRRDCARFGVTPDLKAYLAGRDQGLTQYCKSDNGFRVGESGGQYAGVCPRSLEGDFLAGYGAGHHLFVLRAELRDVDSRLDSRRHELKRIEQTMAEKSAELVAPKTSTKERIDLLAEINSLNQRKNHLRHEVVVLKQTRDLRESELADFQQKLSAR